MTPRLRIIIGLLATIVCIAISGAAHAETKTVAAGSWTKVNYSIAGAWKIVRDDNRHFVVLNDEFKTQRAPDLKIFLSPRALSKLNGSNATRGAIRVAKLKKSKGSQRYMIPANVDLADYKTVIIHCERFSKLWGGAALNDN